ncbi:hypothetical protein PR048_031162 [Dryococelus australis]|uniref:Uncharacterized protein n=1 Tax=Dryococelus australis TaxID=614101 RepID=A0ABQ9G8K5_9NEOP|nr:hypothetical protein PR048_031162 [Dryococelus australis]
MERRRNARAGGTGDPRVNPPTCCIVRNDSHMRKSVGDFGGRRVHIGCLLSQWKATIGPAFPKGCQTPGGPITELKNGEGAERLITRGGVRGYPFPAGEKLGTCQHSREDRVCARRGSDNLFNRCGKGAVNEFAEGRTNICDRVNPTRRRYVHTGLQSRRARSESGPLLHGGYWLTGVAMVGAQRHIRRAARRVRLSALLSLALQQRQTESRRCAEALAQRCFRDAQARDVARVAGDRRELGRDAVVICNNNHGRVRAEFTHKPF